MAIICFRWCMECPSAKESMFPQLCGFKWKRSALCTVYTEENRGDKLLALEGALLRPCSVASYDKNLWREAFRAARGHRVIASWHCKSRRWFDMFLPKNTATSRSLQLATFFSHRADENVRKGVKPWMRVLTKNSEEIATYYDSKR